MSKRLTTEEFIEKARKVWGNKYDYSKVEYINTRSKINILCKEHDIEFSQKASEHLINKEGCKKCYSINMSKTNSSTTKKFVEKARKVWGNKYDYSKVIYKNQLTPIIIICPEHGEFIQKPKYHLMRKGCQECSKNERIKKRTFTTEEFIEKARKVWNDKYDYSKVEYINMNKKICIIYPDYGETWQTPNSHLSGYRTKEQRIYYFIDRAKKIHGDKYDYSLVKELYIDNKNEINIKCNKCNKLFLVRPDLHLFCRSGCPSCNNPKMQNDLSDFIENDLNIPIIRNDRSIIPPLELDIYIPDKNIAIEFNGLYWHSEQVLLKRMKFPKKYHLEKTTACEEKGIRLIQIFEDEWLNKQNIVKNRLQHMLKKSKKIIGARKTSIKVIEAKEKNKFLEEHHIQGKDMSSIKLGAFYKDVLISVMTFCKPRVAMGQKNVEKNIYELSRFAVEFGASYPGLASKIFKYFIRNYEVKEIYTYSDLRWNKIHGNGVVYEKLGMTYIHRSSPNYFYIKDGKRIHRFNYRKQELPKKLEFFDSSKTEYENMLYNGIDRIFDSGNEKFAITIK